MSRFCLVLILGLLNVIGIAQNQPGQAAELPVGSVLRLILPQPLNIEEAKVGDPVRITVAGLVAGGSMKRPRQPLTLVGHITEVQLRTDKQPESRLGITFDKIRVETLTENAREIPVSAIIKRVAHVASSVSNPTSVVPTSGDDPVQRAAGPMVDSYGRPVYSRPPTNQPGPTAHNVYTSDEAIKDLSVHADASNVTTIACRKHNIALEAGTILIVQVTSSGPTN